MINKAIIICTAGLLAAGISMGALASEGEVSILQKVAKSLKSASNSFSFCERADFFGLKFSIRSFNGEMCKNKLVGPVALGLCADKGADKNGKNGFNESQCAKHAVDALLKSTLNGKEKAIIERNLGEDTTEKLLNTLQTLGLD